MSTRTHVTGTIVGLEPVGRSVNGNTSWRFTIMLDSAAYESFVTKANGSVNHNIMRFHPRMPGGQQRVTLTLTRSGRVADITPA